MCTEGAAGTDRLESSSDFNVEVYSLCVIWGARALCTLQRGAGSSWYLHPWSLVHQHRPGVELVFWCSKRK
jgi:hypothetical protein